MASVFTRIINGEIPAHRLAEDDRFLAFLDVSPLAEGHTLVIPKQETDYFFSLDDQLLGDLMVFAKRLVPALEQACPCLRVGVMVVGVEVPHAHVHLIPMPKAAVMNVAGPKLSPTAEELAATAGRIRSFL